MRATLYYGLTKPKDQKRKYSNSILRTRKKLIPIERTSRYMEMPFSQIEENLYSVPQFRIVVKKGCNRSFM